MVIGVDINLRMIYKKDIIMNHIHLAHQYWTHHLSSEDVAIDATCGNGHDSLFLVERCKAIYCYDIQEKAIESTRKQLKKYLDKVHFCHESHRQFSNISMPVRLIVYNLGYLPGSNKKLTTMTDQTLESLQNGLDLIAVGGMLSITTYPGHKEGLKEHHAILEFCKQVDPSQVMICQHQWLNRPLSPTLLIIKKLL